MLLLFFVLSFLLQLFLLISLGFSYFPFSNILSFVINIFFLISKFLSLSSIDMLNYVVLSCAFGGLFYEMGIFSSIPIFYPLAGKSNTLSPMTSKCVSKHCHMSPRRWDSYKMTLCFVKSGNTLLEDITWFPLEITLLENVDS